ncbi:hypothetical protein [Streptomyces acidiscabies]|uniref:Uncharacterized protein n=1 Tax=Streptomyces acidiscabies TaxID=42234 RepID=A0AAP6BKK0_9ACTN|nr:hypothetical protein [Streptomyces acidiscabies]MBZ3913664.1 hypothetical protein [Streptomyces acidiscabies]MDX2966491.1 hypothetical protein [Streptomyces acidiscabies]MDX3025862.1 hypothetical protein [Streptomyces acidiscabies]MDX3796444.1 hypothetical protein [Streptomyces acidiscabies]
MTGSPFATRIARTDRPATGLRLRAATLTQQAGHVPGPWASACATSPTPTTAPVSARAAAVARCPGR